MQMFLKDYILEPHTQSELCFADIHDSDGSSCSSHQNPKGTAKWAASLENLLEDPEGVKRFRVCLFHCWRDWCDTWRSWDMGGWGEHRPVNTVWRIRTSHLWWPRWKGFPGWSWTNMEGAHRLFLGFVWLDGRGRGGEEVPCSLAKSTKNVQLADSWEGLVWISLMWRFVLLCVGVVTEWGRLDNS